MKNKTGMKIAKKYQPALELVEADFDGTWAYTNPGYKFASTDCHTAVADTQKEVYKDIQSITTCDCQECKDVIEKQEREAAEAVETEAAEEEVTTEEAESTIQEVIESKVAFEYPEVEEAFTEYMRVKIDFDNYVETLETEGFSIYSEDEVEALEDDLLNAEVIFKEALQGSVWNITEKGLSGAQYAKAYHNSPDKAMEFSVTLCEIKGFGKDVING